LKYTVLLIDDEQDILDFLSYSLRKEGYQVHLAANAEKGIELATSLQPDLIIIDVMMPGMDGIEACKVIRKDLKLSDPIIAFLTSRSEDYSQIAGFEAGADDYISKPIRPRLLISKIEALLRRKENSQNNLESNSGVEIDREKFEVKVNGKSISLAKKEFELLELLSNRPGKVYNRNQILSLLWGDDYIVTERTIDVHIRKLREKIGNSYIRTIKGVGYTFNEF
jgi:two-component system alkaline phosphatase synthesis response regulator PhoP